MKLSLPSVGALIATFIIASVSSTPADARTICKGSGNSARCHAAIVKKRFTKRVGGARYAQRVTGKHAARLNRTVTATPRCTFERWANISPGERPIFNCE